MHIINENSFSFVNCIICKSIIYVPKIKNSRQNFKQKNPHGNLAKPIFPTISFRAAFS